MTTRTACAILVLAVALAEGCGDTEPSGDQEKGSTTSTGVPYNDKDNDGKAPEDG